ncbi:MAG: dihydrolipoyl dehydrogenase [Gammaproteobacteria bacterium]|nr:dihydrolipoyl dehydrogenase [Gammaproteobacteria bacterium]
MSNIVEIKVPDIGNFKDVNVIDVLVKVGDRIEKEQGLITLETDKATMDVPAPEAGTVKEMKIRQGDKVSEGSVILTVEIAEASNVEKSAVPSPPPSPRGGGEGVRGQGSRAVLAPPPLAGEGGGEGGKSTGIAASVGAAPVPRTGYIPESNRGQWTAPTVSEYTGTVDLECEVLVLGSGPGGYTAAFRAADLGKKVALVERYQSLGGVCLNVGCIPSKALLHAAKVIEEAAEMSERGISFGKPKIDPGKLVEWKSRVVGKLTGGLATLAKQRRVQVVQGIGKFLSPHHLVINGKDGKKVLRFEQCIIAAGSQAAKIPGFPDDPRILDSTSALELEELPERMLVIGGGIIGLEMACVYEALGVKITVVELTDTLIPEADRDLVRVLQKRIEKRYEKILLGVKVAKLEATKTGIKATFDGKDVPAPQTYGRVLVAVGRRPNGKLIDAGKAGVAVDARGFIPVDRQQRTNVSHIFAIGDIAGNPMLAHKASHEGKVAAEVAADMKVANDARAIPSVAYTDPEVAWTGLTEKQAKEQGIEVGKGSFPWAASGRNLSLGRDDGLTKLLFDSKTHRVLGAGIVGVNAGDLIAELTLAIEMGCDAEDISLTIHPHPTLSETVMFSAEAFGGTITDLYVPKKG